MQQPPRLVVTVLGWGVILRWPLWFRQVERLARGDSVPGRAGIGAEELDS